MVDGDLWAHPNLKEVHTSNTLMGCVLFETVRTFVSSEVYGRNGANRCIVYLKNAPFAIVDLIPECLVLKC